jgi:rhodanese-related sulfurtransferase
VNDDGSVQGVSAFGATELLRDGAVLLDVREPEEIAAGRAEAAVAIPLGELAPRLGELSRSSKIVVVCRSGSRSTVAAHVLNTDGFDAFNLDGGMLAWQEAGLPIVSDSGGPGFVL